MLRNPIDRDIFTFIMCPEGLTNNILSKTALDIEEGRLDKDPYLTPMVMYKDMGMYSKMVKAFKNSFKNVHIILYEDFRDNTKKEMIKTFDFLGLKKDENIDFVTRHNVGGKRWKNKNMKYIFMKRNCFKSLLKIFIPKKIRDSLRKKMVKISIEDIEEMNVNTREKLKIIFRRMFINYLK